MAGLSAATGLDKGVQILVAGRQVDARVAGILQEEVGAVILGANGDIAVVGEAVAGIVAQAAAQLDGAAGMRGKVPGAVHPARAGPVPAPCTALAARAVIAPRPRWGEHPGKPVDCC